MDAWPKTVIEAKAPTALGGEALTDAERRAYTQAFLDVPATTAANLPAGFPFSGAELVERAKFAALRLFTSHDGSILSDDFRFVGPVVGPLTKEKFLEAFTSFKLGDAFPDATSSFHNFHVDPFQPNRVWYTSVFAGTHAGNLAGRAPPTGKFVRSGPQAGSFTFDAQGKVSKVTIGYVVDRQVGNTGGLGGVFALFYAVGKPLPFPEGRPWKKSWQFRLLEFVAGVFAFFKNRGKNSPKRRIE